MYIPNDDTQKYPFCRIRLDTELNEPTNHNLIKVPKFVKPTKKTLLQNFGTMSSSSLLNMIPNVILLFMFTLHYMVYKCCNFSVISLIRIFLEPGCQQGIDFNNAYFKLI